MGKLKRLVQESEIYKFQKNFFEHYNPLDGPISSCNQMYKELSSIQQKFDLKYPYKTSDKRYEDEECQLGLELRNLKIIRPGESPRLPKTATEAIAKRLDFMCTYEYDSFYTIKLRKDKKQVAKQKQFIQHKLVEMGIKQFDEKYQRQLLEKYFEDYKKLTDIVDKVEIPGGKISFDLLVMTGSDMDPLTKMTPRQRYDLGCDVNDRGGNFIIAGIPYLIQQGLSYPYNQLIIARSTLKNQLIRSDYLYQEDPVFGNVYQSIFIIDQTKIKKEKSLNINAGTVNDFVLNFKQKHDINFKEGDNYIPITLLFRAYGCMSDKQMLRYMDPKNDRNAKLFFIETMQQGAYHQKHMGQKRRMKQKEALLEIGKIIAKNSKCDNYEDIFILTMIAEYGLSKYIYPISLGEESPFCQTLGDNVYMKYAAMLDPTKLTDRDALFNKRIVTAGMQFIGEIRSKYMETFKSSVRTIINAVSQNSFYDIKKSPNKVQHLFESASSEFTKNYTKAVKKSFTSTQGDNVKILKNMDEQKTAYLSTSQKREIIIKPTSSNGKVGYEQRKIQKSYFGFICYLTTPESGENVGRYLSPTIYSHVTNPQHANKVEEYILSHKLFTKKMDRNVDYMAVKINYKIKGYVKHGKDFIDLYEDLMQWRRKNAFDTDKPIGKIIEHIDQLFISVYYSIERNEINVNTDGGRLMIPIFSKKFEDGDDFVDMLRDGKAQYICSNMIQNFIVEEYTEIGKVKDVDWFIGPSGALGFLPGVNPLQNHNKGTRSSLSTAQMKGSQCQSIQNYTNYYLKNLLINNTNQSQIIYSPLQEVCFKDTPTTQLVFLAVMPYTDNQEDALILCEDFAARGGFATTSFKCYSAQKIGLSEEFSMPMQVRKEYNYSKLNQTQFQITKMGTNIKYNDVLIVKTKTLDKDTKLDQSIVYDSTQEGLYACVCNVNNYTFNPTANLKMVRIMFGRTPSIGDKVASVNAQKSTIGKMLKGYEMPITESGIIVNMLQDNNPIMRRETYGQPLEILLSKYISSIRKLRLQVSQDQPIIYQEELKKMKLDKMYRPDYDEFFGNPEVMCAAMNYTVQKHVVDEKIRYRAEEGKIDIISKQSASGKKYQGGLKIGDMERHDLTSSGVCNLLKEFFGRLSSNVQYYICRKCGSACVHWDKNLRQFWCQGCGKPLLESETVKNGYSYNALLLNHVFFACAAIQNFVDIEQK